MNNQSSKSIRTRVILISFYALLTTLFLGGVFAGRWTASYPLNRTFGHWDIATNLGSAAKAKGSPASVAEAFFDPQQALEDMDNYLWVPQMTAVPLLDFSSAAIAGSPIVGPGFRNTHEPVSPKEPGYKRVFLIGGSTAFSVGAPSEEWTIGRRIEYHLQQALKQPVEVFTLATPSWTSNQERAAALNIVAPLQPNLVISLSGVNDLAFAQLGRDPHLQRGHYEQTFFEALSLAHQLAGRGPIHDAVPSSPSPIPVERSLQRIVENTALIRYGLERMGSSYLYVQQPTIYAASRLSPRERTMLSSQPSEKVAYFVEAYPKITAAVSAELGDDHFLNLADTFAELGEDVEVFIDAYHFGDRGNEHIAQAIARKAATLFGDE
ncbi:MAG: SGNH/GDSL hydrolase family protein [Myxococcales bacterium]|nr:SGNH/GDSL hydrolase family protein [Myxococcales bacterium]